MPKGFSVFNVLHLYGRYQASRRGPSLNVHPVQLMIAAMTLRPVDPQIAFSFRPCGRNYRMNSSILLLTLDLDRLPRHLSTVLVSPSSLSPHKCTTLLGSTISPALRTDLKPLEVTVEWANRSEIMEDLRTIDPLVSHDSSKEGGRSQHPQPRREEIDPDAIPNAGEQCRRKRPGWVNAVSRKRCTECKVKDGQESYT